jgi:hypothetical protein
VAAAEWVVHHDLVAEGEYVEGGEDPTRSCSESTWPASTTDPWRAPIVAPPSRAGNVRQAGGAGGTGVGDRPSVGKEEAAP